MASSLPIDPAVDKMLDAFDRAKELYYRGQPGPYRLDGTYTLAEFEQFSTLMESTGQLSFSDDDGVVFLWGDPSFPHEGMSSYLVALLGIALREHVRTAPASGVVVVDEGTMLPLVILRSPRIILRRTANHAQRVQHPAGTNNGIIRKEPDMYAVLGEFLSSTGRDIPVIAFEGAVHNETIQTLLWEVVRHREAGQVAGSPHFVALGVKAQVSSSCFKFQ
jgi:hypothetical protein